MPPTFIHGNIINIQHIFIYYLNFLNLSPRRGDINGQKHTVKQSQMPYIVLKQ